MRIDAYKAFVMMFYALDAAFNNCPSDELGQYFSAVNPFLFKGEGSADKTVFEEFKSRYPDGADELTSYQFTRNFLIERGNYLLEAFDSTANASNWKEVLDQT